MNNTCTRPHKPAGAAPTSDAGRGSSSTTGRSGKELEVRCCSGADHAERVTYSCRHERRTRAPGCSAPSADTTAASSHSAGTKAKEACCSSPYLPGFSYSSSAPRGGGRERVSGPQRVFGYPSPRGRGVHDSTSKRAHVLAGCGGKMRSIGSRPGSRPAKLARHVWRESSSRETCGGRGAGVSGSWPWVEAGGRAAA